MESLCVHDNTINSYTVDIDNAIITFKSTSESNEIINIIFKNVLAHRFEHVIDSNILFDISEVDINYFINDYKANLSEWLRYGFPNSSKDCLTLEEFLINNHYKVFYIGSSLGLNGFVIAKFLELNN